VCGYGTYEVQEEEEEEEEEEELKKGETRRYCRNEVTSGNN
jgi:hypothetical protein